MMATKQKKRVYELSKWRFSSDYSDGGMGELLVVSGWYSLPDEEDDENFFVTDLKEDKDYIKGFRKEYGDEAVDKAIRILRAHD